MSRTIFLFLRRNFSRSLSLSLFILFRSSRSYILYRRLFSFLKNQVKIREQPFALCTYSSSIGKNSQSSSSIVQTKQSNIYFPRQSEKFHCVYRSVQGRIKVISWVHNDRSGYQPCTIRIRTFIAISSYKSSRVKQLFPYDRNEEQTLFRSLRNIKSMNSLNRNFLFR